MSPADVRINVVAKSGIGFAIEGKAELYIEGQRILLEPGDSWVVPKGAKHRYKILASFTAVEATSPPAEVHARNT